MAFNPYAYGGYQPAYYPGPVPDQLAQLRQQQMQPQMIQPPVQPMQPQPVQQPASQGGGINWVGSKLEADNWPIAPGCAVALWDSNNPVIYLRQADSTAKPSTKVYDLVERTDAPTPQQSTPEIDMSRYVTIDQLEEILAERLKRPAKAAKVKEDTENG